MEELRSTDILDKEIQEDARKKAERILSSAQEEVQKILNSVDDRLESVKREKEKAYEEKIRHFEKDCEASAPLEKERFLVSFQAKAVREAVDAYLSGLSVEKKLVLLEKLLEHYRSALEGKKLNVRVYAFDTAKVRTLITKTFGSGALESCSAFEVSEICGSSDFIKEMEGFIIETTDRSVRCRVLLSELVQDLIDRRSYELTVTLFGGRIPQ